MQQRSLRRSSWEWIQQQPDFKSHELAAALGKDRTTITLIITHFLRKGWVRIVDKLKRPHTYQKVEGATPCFSDIQHRSHVTSPRQKIWQVMRFISTFSVADIEAASEESTTNIQAYISYLRRAGYITKINSKGTPVFRLKCNTGRLYPIVRRNAIYDQNTRELVPFAKKAAA